jgi:predicted ATPase/DNA-binding winged helix-turn-helix (wHTH) protein
LLEQVIVFGPFELYPVRRRLLEGGRPLRVGGRAFDILVALAERPGEVVGKDELTARVWPGIAVEEANLRAQVAALRKALGDGQPGRRFVTNIPGRGYSLVAPVTRGRWPDTEPAGPRLRAMTHDLPVRPARVIGRRDDVNGVATELRRRRLVTVVGPGGIGKTTVALAVADAVASSYPDGIAFLDLAPINDPSLVPGALASALGIAGRGGDAGLALASFLRDKALLVVLDGCEHVIEATATLAEALLAAGPGLGVLATSTEPLRAAGEWVRRLPPLGIPPAAPPGMLTAAEALRFPAVQLFVERVAAALGGFDLRDADAPAVAEICRSLDGMALAIELAAGRADAFSPRELAGLLDDRFRVLTRGRRTALPRHRTLRATLDWSHGLLTPPERTVLRRLSVFNGAFGLAAAAEVAQGDEIAGPEVDELLASLVEKSLVVVRGGDAEAMYGLLDTTRAFAWEKLAQAGEAEALARRHAEHVRRLFERAEAEWETRPTAEWVGAYAPQLGNLRSALDWAFSPGGDTAVGVALTAAAVPLWCQLSLMDEGLRRVERALAAFEAGPDRDERRRTRLHAALGWLQMYATARLDGSAEAWRTALGLAERLGDTDYQLRAVWALWADRQNHGEFRASLALARRFCALAAAAPEPADRLVGERMTAAALHFLGDQSGAREHVERMLERYVAPARRSHVVRFQFDQRVTARITLARVLWVQGFADRAMQEVESNIADALAGGHGLTLCNALAQAACPVALLAGDLAAAERFLAILRGYTTEPALDVWRAYADCFEGELLVRRGDSEGGLRLLRPAVETLQRVDFVQYLTPFVAALAQGIAARGGLENALAALEGMLARCGRTGERWYLAELLRLRGELRAARPGPGFSAEGEVDLQEALSIAREQGAVSWELRASTSLAELWRRQGRGHEARHLLAQVYGRFTEGFGTADLLHATAMLKELE